MVRVHANQFLKNERGFSLIELLITVVIVGVLATVGVPQYRRMVYKAKKAEAKVLLGAIYTAEATFFSEYGAYGNNIARMGAEMTGASFYIGGFNQSADEVCTPLADADILPTTATVPSIPATYTTAGTNDGLIGLSPTGREICATQGTYQAAADGTTFLAFASANLLSSAADATCTSSDSPRCDVWSINQGNTLALVADGTP